MKKQINGFDYIQYSKTEYTELEMQARSTEFHQMVSSRRSVRHFSEKDFPISIIENCIMAANTAPSGAHKQPWTFCLVGDKNLKKQIREAAEQEEKLSYEQRMSDEWLKDLAPLGTDWQKPFLEIAPYLIVVFKRSYEIEENGHKHQNYYVTESVGLACGILLTALHNSGLATLTHTPSPMNFLTRLLKRPENEKPFLLIPVGYAAEDCWVPDIKRKSLKEIMVEYV